MSDIPNVDDPALAVVLDRFTRFESDFKSWRTEHNEKFDKQDQRLSNLESKFDKFHGGYLVLVGLGGVASYLMGAFDWLIKYLTLR